MLYAEKEEKIQLGPGNSDSQKIDSGIDRIDRAFGCTDDA